MAMMSLAMAVTYGILTASTPNRHDAIGDKEKEFIRETHMTYNKVFNNFVLICFNIVLLKSSKQCKIILKFGLDLTFAGRFLQRRGWAVEGGLGFGVEHLRSKGKIYYEYLIS